MTKENYSVQKFVFAVNDMVSSKYILVDQKISAVLSAIASSSEVYNLIAECMVNFDFLQEWKIATKGEFLKLPDSPAKKISFIFCMLNNIDDHNIDIRRILERYFSYDKNISPYELFNKTIMTQFEKLVLSNLKPAEIQEEFTYISNETTDDFEILIKNLKNLLKILEDEKKIKKTNMKIQDVIAVVSTFMIVVKKREIDYFYAFLAILNSIFCKDKKYEKIIDKIIDISNKIIGD